MAHSTHQTGVLRRLTSRAGIAGLTLLAVSAVILLATSKMRFGTASQMGPGYFPTVLAVILAGFGLVLLVEGWRNPDERISTGPLGPPALLMGAIVAFAVLYEIAGAFIALIFVTMIAALAEGGRSRIEWVLLPLGICLGVWLLFGVALDLQLKFFPDWLNL